MKYFSRIILSLSYILLPLVAKAQIIVTEPALPQASDAVLIYFDASLGTAGLQDYTGDIYAHTGVLTENSTDNKDWKYVKTAWNENIPETKLTKVSDNLYSLNINPSIREYYEVPENEAITHLAFVFRNADGTREGKDDGGSDIFVEVFEPGLNVSIVLPDKNQLLEAGSSLEFKADVSEASSLEVFLNDASVVTSTATSISHSFNFVNPGDYWIKVVASLGEEVDMDSVFVHILESQVEESMPPSTLAGINYLDDQSLTLALYAPGKEHVFVIGDFNNWTPGSDFRCKKDGDYWWISLDNLTAGKEYAFQYLVDGELLIADPYTEKILDPNNDKWISDETYPGLMDYPASYTSGITSVFQTAQPEYQWKNTDFTAPPVEKLVIYELLVRDFVAKHDWKTLIDTIGYLKRLGVNAIELMPFNEFEGNESWGYNPSFYFAPDKYYGPKNDLKAFIDTCHGNGIAVIMDMVLNHSYSQSPLVQLYYDEATFKVTPTNPWYNVESPNTAYSWGYDFNHESTATKAFMDSVNSYWMTYYKIDGYRFDFTKGFTNTPGDGWAYDADRINILKRMADEIWAVNPDAYVILEHLSENSEETVLANYGMLLWGNLNYAYNEATMGYHASNKSDFSWISYKKRGWTDPHLVGYMESHDEERLMYKNLQYGNASGDYNIQSLNTALPRIELAAAFFITIPGPKMIWQFGEMGYDYSIDYNGRVGNKPIRWDYLDYGKRLRLTQVFAALIDLKKNEAAFSTTDYTLAVNYSTKRIELNHEEMDVRILGNFDVATQSIDPNFSSTGTWYEYFSGDSIVVSDTHELISTEAGEYLLYTTKRLSVPEIIDHIPANTVDEHTLLVYPNPAKEIIHISELNMPATVQIFDLNGKLMLKKAMTGTDSALNIGELETGMYILISSDRYNKKQYHKLIKE